jgi:hypothetical protein
MQLRLIESWSSFLWGLLIGGWMTYLWLNPYDPYANVKTGNVCGDDMHWVVTSTKRACLPD